MPKETFFRLKEDKRNKIIDVAMNEFATYGFALASVNRIVKEAHIATGSFYQYFEDMNDLICFVCLSIFKKKNQYMKAEISDIDTTNIEDFFRAIYRGGIRFALEDKEACKLSNSFFAISNTPLYTAILDKISKENDSSWIFLVLDKAIKSGQLRKDITPQLMLDISSGITKSVINYLDILDSNGQLSTNEDTLNQFSELAVSILLNGISN